MAAHSRVELLEGFAPSPSTELGEQACVPEYCFPAEQSPRSAATLERDEPRSCPDAPFLWARSSEAGPQVFEGELAVTLRREALRLLTRVRCEKEEEKGKASPSSSLPTAWALLRSEGGTKSACLHDGKRRLPFQTTNLSRRFIVYPSKSLVLEPPARATKSSARREGCPRSRMRLRRYRQNLAACFTQHRFIQESGSERGRKDELMKKPSNPANTQIAGVDVRAANTGEDRRGMGLTSDPSLFVPR